MGIRDLLTISRNPRIHVTSGRGISEEKKPDRIRDSSV